MAEKNKKEKKEEYIHEVVFFTYPKYIFCWPLIVMGFLLWPIDAMNLLGKAHTPEILAWVYGLTIMLVIVTMGVDLNRNYTVFWLVVIVAFWLLIVVLNMKNIPIFKQIYHFFADLDPVYSRSMGIIISIPLLVGFGIMWGWTRVNCRWRITHNEFEHYQFGRLDDSIARGAKRIRSSYPDFFELLLCLAGDLIIFDASGRKELRRIQHVPMLPFVKKRINVLLESTSVTSNGEVEDEYEASESTDDDYSDDAGDVSRD